MRYILILIFLLTCEVLVYAQDSTRVLNEIVIEAYQYKRPLLEVPVSVGVVQEAEIARFNSTSILPVVNTLPGIRMEERSPGSYRFSIRGSLIRSPFGVRNVKMYLNGLPFSDAGGNTYLNLIDLSNVGSIEIIKGPAGSLYGAGTGGVVLLNTPTFNNPSAQVSYQQGSYGMQRYSIGTTLGTEKTNASISYSHQEADGYRNQSAMSRDALHTNLHFSVNAKSILKATIFYTDLFYQTPGGLNKQQAEEDPTQARPASNAIGGAVEQNASVNNKTIYGGLMYDYQWNNYWSTRTSVYSSFSDFHNYAIFNYEERDETNLGGRIENQYELEGKGYLSGKVSFGAEYQFMDSPVNVYDNIQGAVGQLSFADDLQARHLLLFTQAELVLQKNFFITVGGSINATRYKFYRKPPEDVKQSRTFDEVFSPRLALLKKISPSLSIFSSVSSGFSTPSLAEVRPSTGTFSNSLQPERGINYELGMRGSALKNQVNFDVTLYHFALKETIVIQRAEDGAEYFINAGRTEQRGIEAMANWSPKISSNNLITAFKLWTSYTYNHYRFKDYIQNNEDYSGNKLTGVAPTIFASGVDVSFKRDIYFYGSANYTDHIPLNDANTEYANSFVLVSTKLGYQKKFKDYHFNFYVGADNLLDQEYSLGNDLNAVGTRYYNPAAPKTFYVGLTAQAIFKAQQ